MKSHNLIKNLYAAGATATLYYGFVLDAIPTYIKWIGTVWVFGVVMLCLTSMDKHAFEKWKEKHRRVRPKIKESA